MTRLLVHLPVLLGSLLLGTAGALAFAAPAQAHHASIDVAKKCQDGTAVLTWTVTNSERRTARIVQLKTTPDAAPITGFGKDTVISARVVGTQQVKADVEVAKLEIWLRWSNGFGGTFGKYEAKSVDLRTLDCGPGFTASVGGSAECDAKTGSWRVTWTVSNGHKGIPAQVRVLNDGDISDTTALKSGGGWVRLADPAEIAGLPDGRSVPSAPAITATQTLPATVTAARLKIELLWQVNSKERRIHQAVGTVDFEGVCGKNAQVTFASDCGGDVKATLTNPAKGRRLVNFIVTGDGFNEAVSVGAGETTVVGIPAGAAGNIVVTAGGDKVGEYAWQTTPRCHPVQLRAVHSCQGLTVHLSNPAKGVAMTAALTPGEGEPITKLLQPGDTAALDFAGVKGALDVAVDGRRSGSVTWLRPAGCAAHDGKVGNECDGLEFKYGNPAGGSEVAVKLVPNGGEAQLLTLRPGESKQVSLKAQGSVLRVDETVDGRTVTWEWEKPRTCALPQAELQKAGSVNRVIVLSGSAFLAVGAIALYLTRRRWAR